MAGRDDKHRNAGGGLTKKEGKMAGELMGKLKEFVKQVNVPWWEGKVDIDQADENYPTVGCITGNDKEANDAVRIETIYVEGEKAIKFRFKSEVAGKENLFGTEDGGFGNYVVLLTESGQLFAAKTRKEKDGRTVPDLSTKHLFSNPERVALALAQSLGCYASKFVFADYQNNKIDQNLAAVYLGLVDRMDIPLTTEVAIDVDPIDGGSYPVLSCNPVGEDTVDDAVCISTLDINGERAVKFRFKSEVAGEKNLFGTKDGGFADYAIFMTDSKKIFAASVKNEAEKGQTVCDFSNKYFFPDDKRVRQVLSQALDCYAAKSVFTDEQNNKIDPNLAAIHSLAVFLNKNRGIFSEGIVQKGCKWWDIPCQETARLGSDYIGY